MQQVLQPEERHREAELHGPDTEADADMGLPHAGRPLQQHRLRAADPGAGGQRLDLRRSIDGWKAKSKFSSVCPVGRPDSRSDVLTRRSSRSDSSAASNRSRNACAGTSLRTASPSRGPRCSAAWPQPSASSRSRVASMSSRGLARAHRATSASAAYRSIERCITGASASSCSRRPIRPSGAGATTRSVPGPS